MNKTELKRLWQHEEKIAHIHGWNFSYLNGRYNPNEDKLPWNYESVVKKYLRPDMKMLDIDTGGGEVLISFKHPYALTSATEAYPPNVKLCKEILLPLGIDFHESSNYSDLPFDDCEFDIVLNRHGAYDLKEIKRILKNDGIFVTQQVGEQNNHELIEQLCPDCYSQFKNWNLSSQIKCFNKYGFDVLKSDECFVKSVFYDIGAIVWYAKIIEWEFVDFSVENNFEQLLKMQKMLEQQGKIESSAHRFIIVGRK